MESLSKREIEVLKLVAAGYSDRGIGKKLFISDTTVRTHLSNIYRKTGIAPDENYNQRILLIHNVLNKIRGKDERKN